MRCTCIALTVVLAAAGAAAGTIPFRLAATPDPLRSASLPLDLAPAAAVAAGEWRVEASLAYANLWQGTWEISAIHQEWGRVGEPIGSDELREIESRYPDSEMYRVDIESWRADLAIQRGFAHGLVLTVQIPYVEVGGPHWDGIAEWWHENLSLPNADRYLFPRGQTFLYAYSRGTTLELRDELAAAGIGDVTVSLAAPLGSLAGAEQRVVRERRRPDRRRGHAARQRRLGRRRALVRDVAVADALARRRRRVHLARPLRQTSSGWSAPTPGT